MATAIRSATISSELVSDTDYIFEGAALPNATSATSSVFKVGGSQAGIEIVGKAGTEIVVADGETLTYDLYTSTASDSGFTLKETVKQYAPSGDSTTIALGTEMFRYVPGTDVDVWGKITVTASDDQSSDTHTVQIEKIAR